MLEHQHCPALCPQLKPTRHGSKSARFLQDRDTTQNKVYMQQHHYFVTEYWGKKSEKQDLFPSKPKNLFLGRKHSKISPAACSVTLALSHFSLTNKPSAHWKGWRKAQPWPSSLHPQPPACPSSCPWPRHLSPVQQAESSSICHCSHPVPAGDDSSSHPAFSGHFTAALPTISYMHRVYFVPTLSQESPACSKALAEFSPSTALTPLSLYCSRACFYAVCHWQSMNNKIRNIPNITLVPLCTIFTALCGFFTFVQNSKKIDSTQAGDWESSQAY